MKMVGPGNASAQVLDDKPLMLFNRSLLGIRYIRQLLASTKTSFTSTGGTALPTELWNMILRFALDDTQDSFCFAQGISLGKSLIGEILHCRVVSLEDGPLCGDLDNYEEVDAFEEFMNKPNQHTSLPFTEPTLRLGQTFEILITPADDGLPADSACLFSDVTVPDIISCMEDGDCSFCSNSRFICPGCTGGRAQKFEVFMGCGVELACPLCMGTDFSQEHKGFLQEYYWHEPLEAEQRLVDDWLQQRLEEFGY
jgi:hypothetical protein